MRPDGVFTNPGVTPFVECPNCHRLIDHRLDSCPHCREEIDDDYAELSRVMVVYNTAACSSANTIKTVEYAGVLVLIATGIGVWTASPALILDAALVSVIFTVAVFVWFRRFGRTDFGDPDYAKAKRDMKISLILWLAFIVIQSLALGYVALFLA